MGSRLGMPYPKPLTVLRTGQSILAHQIANLSRHISLEDILVVVGFKKELIMEAFPKLMFVYNDRYDTTNTSKSLLNALEHLGDTDVLWLNGDVVFDARVLDLMMKPSQSCMAVNSAAVGDEEVKYRTARDGRIVEVSKHVAKPEGEAVGINRVIRRDLPLLIESLRACNDMDYFERGIELSLKEGARFFPIDVNSYPCTEVDFAEDLERANRELGATRPIKKARGL
jgi:choline kinase